MQKANVCPYSEMIGSFFSSSFIFSLTIHKHKEIDEVARNERKTHAFEQLNFVLKGLFAKPERCMCFDRNQSLYPQQIIMYQSGHSQIDRMCVGMRKERMLNGKRGKNNNKSTHKSQ